MSIIDTASIDNWYGSVIGRLRYTFFLWQVIFVNVRYGSPRPKAAVMELSRDGGITFDPIQYYADDCMFYFGLPNNGQIVNADDANCVISSAV